MELRKLIEEWTIEIVWLAVFASIPFVAPPNVFRVDLPRRVWRVYGDDVFLGKITGTLVEMAFVSVGHAALEAAGRAECRLRYI